MTSFYKTLAILCVTLAILSTGCSSTSSEWGSGEVPGVGLYTPPSPGFQKHRLGVLNFEDKTGGGPISSAAAADQLTTLLVKAQRFIVIERTRINDLLKEQNLHGIVRQDQMAQAGQVLGAELLCYGSITDFEIKRTGTRSGGGILRGVGGVFVPQLSVLDIDFSKEQLDFHIGVDVRIVDSTTGEIVFAESQDVKRTETASGMGLSLVGLSVGSEARVEVDNENQGRLLRLGLDMVVKKLLPLIDQKYGN